MKLKNRTVSLEHVYSIVSLQCMQTSSVFVLL